MAGDHHEPYDNPKLKGLVRYFNGQTVRGRANVAKATLGTIFAYILYKTVIARHLPDSIIPQSQPCPAVTCPAITKEE